MVSKRFCQRCGYPKYDKKYTKGTEKDGKESDLYCNKCLNNGEFFFPEMTKQEMYIMIVDMSKDYGWWMGFTMKHLFSRQLYNLSYWKSSRNIKIEKKYSKEISESNKEKYKEYYKKYL